MFGQPVVEAGADNERMWKMDSGLLNTAHGPWCPSGMTRSIFICLHPETRAPVPEIISRFSLRTAPEPKK